MDSETLNITSRSTVALCLSMVAGIVALFLLPRGLHIFIISGLIFIFILCIVLR